MRWLDAYDIWAGRWQVAAWSSPGVETQNGMYRFALEENAALPHAGRDRNTRFGFRLNKVGPTGFEPATF